MESIETDFVRGRVTDGPLCLNWWYFLDFWNHKLRCSLLKLLFTPKVLSWKQSAKNYSSFFVQVVGFVYFNPNVTIWRLFSYLSTWTAAFSQIRLGTFFCERHQWAPLLTLLPLNPSLILGWTSRLGHPTLAILNPCCKTLQTITTTEHIKKSSVMLRKGKINKN